MAAGQGKTVPNECFERWQERAETIRENVSGDAPAVRIRKLADVVARIASELDRQNVADYKVDAADWEQ